MSIKPCCCYHLIRFWKNPELVRMPHVLVSWPNVFVVGFYPIFQQTFCCSDVACGFLPHQWLIAYPLLNSCDSSLHLFVAACNLLIGPVFFLLLLRFQRCWRFMQASARAGFEIFVVKLVCFAFLFFFSWRSSLFSFLFQSSLTKTTIVLVNIYLSNQLVCWCWGIGRAAHPRNVLWWWCLLL